MNGHPVVGPPAAVSLSPPPAPPPAPPSTLQSTATERGAEPSAGGDGDRRRYVIHVPVTVRDLDGAKALARALALSVGHISQIDARRTTVSAEDAPEVRHRVFCNRLLVRARGRCRREYGHAGPCEVRR
jgi:hypothetical protein